MGPGVNGPRQIGCVLGCGLLFLATATYPQLSPLAPGAGEADIVLQRRDWDTFRPLSVVEVLERIPGVVVVNRGGLGSPEYLAIAGSVNGRVRVVIDGVDFNEPEFDWPRLEAVPVAAIDRIELHRTSEPVRLEIWTSVPQDSVTLSAFDFGRGDLGTRTRRIEFATPPGTWRVGMRYEELLRAEDDFRTVPEGDPGEFFGAHDRRGVSYWADFARGKEALAFRHEKFNANAHGSFASTSDVTRTLRASSDLRWSRPLGASTVRLDLAHLAWDRDRKVDGKSEQVSESRARGRLELELPERRSWRPSVRVEARRLQGERPLTPTRTQHGEYAAELELRRQGVWYGGAWLGAERHEMLGNDWSGRLQVGWRTGAWSLVGRGGRGISYPGWGDDTQAVRAGHALALAARHAGARATLEIDLFRKWFEGTKTAAGHFFPSLEVGPESASGLMARLAWDHSPRVLDYGLEARLAWTPQVEGDRAAIPRLQADLVGKLARSDWFEGDLSVELDGTFRFMSRRDFAPGVGVDSHAHGSAALNVVVLHRLRVFWTLVNISDERYELHPGVRDPGRRSLVGLQVQLFN